MMFYYMLLPLSETLEVTCSSIWLIKQEKQIPTGETPFCNFQQRGRAKGRRWHWFKRTGPNAGIQQLHNSHDEINT